MAQNDLGNLPPASTVAPAGQPAQPAGKRGRKPGSKPKVRAELPKDAFVIESVPTDERGKVRRVRVERSEQQRAIDDKALAVYKEWKAAGSPSDWLKMPVKRWLIEKRYVEDALFFLNKGAALHGKRLVVGDIQPAADHPGKVRIPFCVTDRRQHDEPETATAEATSE